MKGLLQEVTRRGLWEKFWKLFSRTQTESPSSSPGSLEGRAAYIYTKSRRWRRRRRSGLDPTLIECTLIKSPFGLVIHGTFFFGAALRASPLRLTSSFELFLFPA